jgi:glycerol uptake facilitator-like aquaporin
MGLIVVAIGSVVLAQSLVNDVFVETPPYIFVFINAIAVAFVLFALIETFSPLSGAHFNPAVTIALTVAGECPPKKACYYICAQMAGAIFGMILVNLFFYDVTGSLYFISDIDRSSIYLILSEFFCTFMLVAIIFGCVRGGSSRTPLVVGMFVGGMIITTSSTMFANPAIDVARIFTDAACGIAPLSALYFIIAGIAGAIASSVLFGWLYPVKLKKGEKCDAFDCSTKEDTCCEKNMVVIEGIER